MNTKKCKHCQSEIDAKAKRCPQCQGDLRNWFARHPILTGILGLTLLVIVVSTVGGGKEGNKSTSTPNPTQEQSASASPASTQVEAVKVDTLAFIAEFDKNQLAAEEKYEDKLVEFTAVIANISEDIVGKPFLSLKPTTEEFYLGTTIKCTFDGKSQLTGLENSQRVSLQGVVNTQSLGIIDIEKCREIVK